MMAMLLNGNDHASGQNRRSLNIMFYDNSVMPKKTPGGGDRVPKEVPCKNETPKFRFSNNQNTSNKLQIYKLLNWVNRMDEKQVIEILKRDLVTNNRQAALNNYNVLCNNILFLNNAIADFIKFFSEFCNNIQDDLSKDENLLSNICDASEATASFRIIIPRILTNDLHICIKEYEETKPDNRTEIDLSNITLLSRKFKHYNSLMTSTRQFIDSLVTDAYQMLMFDAREFNYYVLSSLSSFNKFATKSLRECILTDDLKNVLRDFDSMSGGQQRNGTYSKCDKTQFGDKIDYIYNQTSPTTTTKFKSDIKNLFKFSSDFAHIGYASSYFSIGEQSEIVFSDDIGPYFPSTENFSEVKFEILISVLRFLQEIYMPCLEELCKKIFINGVVKKYIVIMKGQKEKLASAWLSRNSHYYFFVCNNIINSNQTIPLHCKCGYTNFWKSPHDLSELFCENCGSEFSLIELEGDCGFVFTSEGPILPIGSTLPPFEKLSIEEQNRIIDECKKQFAHKEK